MTFKSKAFGIERELWWTNRSEVLYSRGKFSV